MIPKGKGLPKFADDSTLNQIRGKAMVGHQSIEDVWRCRRSVEQVIAKRSERVWTTWFWAVRASISRTQY